MIARFIKHIFPKSFRRESLRPEKTLYLGSAAFASFALLLITGVLLLLYYIPGVNSAYDSIIFLEEKVFGGAFIRSLHRMSSHFLLVTAAAHLLRTVYTGAYSVRPKNWKLGYIIAALMIFEAYTGYLLPFDQLSYWAAMTGMELVAILPLGSFIRGILAPDGVGGQLTLLRFFTLHIVFIPMLCIGLTWAHMYNIRRDGGLLPMGESPKQQSDPALYRFTAAIFLSVVAMLCLLAVIFPAPLTIPANPAEPPNPVKSAWFLLWFQEIVSWRASLFNVAAIIFVVFFFLPDMRRGYKPVHSRWFAAGDRKVWLIITLTAVCIIALTIVAMFFRGENWSFVF
ncbi:cytochrome b N-terminal domain-containing protein [Limisalsivibrio acetivorans]|uniref:cytochrome b N-terminal domain-containing protein n=1 Tax=Limisalsivibrio acetivorans TaxID=1304888 RepID=UPI0003B616B1|nr:cytochrome b N-terminal domain-containing protein [Limisalsivibrio acetivorans]